MGAASTPTTAASAAAVSTATALPTATAATLGGMVTDSIAIFIDEFAAAGSVSLSRHGFSYRLLDNLCGRTLGQFTRGRLVGDCVRGFFGCELTTCRALCLTSDQREHECEAEYGRITGHFPLSFGALFLFAVSRR